MARAVGSLLESNDTNTHASYVLIIATNTSALIFKTTLQGNVSWNRNSHAIAISAVQVDHSNDRFLPVHSVTVDTTERDPAEEKFRLAVEACPNGMVTIDRAGKMVMVNAAIEQQFGYRREDLIGRPIGQLAPVSKDAEKHLAEMEGRRLHVEEALRESQEQYRMLLDGVEDHAIFMMDPQGQVVSWNAGAERIKGYRADEIIGHNFSCFFLPEDIERGRPEEVLRITAASGRH